MQLLFGLTIHHVLHSSPASIAFTAINCFSAIIDTSAIKKWFQEILFSSWLLNLLIIPKIWHGILLVKGKVGNNEEFSDNKGQVIHLWIYDAKMWFARCAFNEQQIKRMGLKEAIYTGGSRRLNPIIMVTIVSLFSTLPVLFGSGLGIQLQRPMALALIGGMTLGTFVSLYFIPLAYWYIYRRRGERVWLAMTVRLLLQEKRGRRTNNNLNVFICYPGDNYPDRR